MGIGITSNLAPAMGFGAEAKVSIPNGDRHYLEHREVETFGNQSVGFNPQWG